MRSVFSLLAVGLPLVAALSMDVPTNPTSGGTVHVTWSSVTGDPPVFSIELQNPNNFHNSFAIANNVDTSVGEVDILLPIVPVGDGYALQAVDIGNITNVYAQSGFFSIGPIASGSVSSTASRSGSSSGTLRSTTSTLTTPTSTTIPVPSPTTTTTDASTATGSAFSSNSIHRFAFSASNAAAAAVVLFAVLAGGAVVAL